MRNERQKFFVTVDFFELKLYVYMWMWNMILSEMKATKQIQKTQIFLQTKLANPFPQLLKKQNIVFQLYDSL